MNNFKKILKIFSVVIILFGCQNNNRIEDIISPINLTAGIADSVLINDLYYSENYDIKVIDNPNLQTQYNVKDKKIIIKSDSGFEGMTLLNFKADMNVYSIPVISKKEKFYKFLFKPDKKYNSINLFGSFNGWNRTNLPMEDKDGDGTFKASVALEPGVYQYKFFADGIELEDPLNPEKVSNGMGSFNSIRTIEDTNKEKFFLHVDSFTELSDEVKYSFYLENKNHNKLKSENVFALLNNIKIDTSNIAIADSKIEVKLNKFKGVGLLRVAVSQNGRVSNIQSVNVQDGKPIADESFTWKDAIIYSLMIDRFYDGDSANNEPIEHDSLSFKANYMGGDLKGVLDKLEDGYFEKLGINVIWISPVYDNPNEAYKEYPAPHRYYSGYHGYWPISPNKVDEHFGDLNDVKNLVNAAHSKNIKVLLDFVSNHVHEQHPFFQNHRKWFGKLKLPDGRLNLRFWDEFRLTTWFEPYLPSFDYLGSEEALEEMTDLAVWWLKETGADGYRHDAVKHVPNKFWRRLNEKIKKELGKTRDLDVYQIGETFGSYELISSYVNNGQLSSQFNFNLYDVAIPTFTREGSSFSTLDKEMNKTFSVYGVNHLMGNVMDSHDKNRFMAYADNDLDPSQWSAIEEGWNNPPMVDNPESYKKLKLYLAYMNTIPGLPVIYYGSEFGMTGASDPDNRRMMRFDDELSEDEKNTLNDVSKIINLRKQHSALRYGDFYTLQADENIYAYVRSDMNERILVVLNKSNLKQSIHMDLPDNYSETSVIDLTNGQSIKLSDSPKIHMEPQSWKILKLVN